MIDESTLEKPYAKKIELVSHWLDRQASRYGQGNQPLALMFKLAESTSKSWKRLKGCDKFDFVANGFILIDGELQQYFSAILHGHMDTDHA